MIVSNLWPTKALIVVLCTWIFLLYWVIKQGRCTKHPQISNPNNLLFTNQKTRHQLKLPSTSLDHTSFQVRWTKCMVFYIQLFEPPNSLCETHRGHGSHKVSKPPKNVLKFWEIILWNGFFWWLDHIHGPNPKLCIGIRSYLGTFLVSIILGNRDKLFYQRTRARSKNVKLLIGRGGGFGERVEVGLSRQLMLRHSRPSCKCLNAINIYIFNYGILR